MNPRQTIKGKSFAQRSLRALAFVLPATFAILPVATATAEASSICRQIQHQLASVAQMPRQDAKRLDRAVRDSRKAGCGPTGFASTHDTHCRIHAQRIHDLQRFAFVPAGSARGDARREHARLTSALRVNGCVGRQAGREQVAARADRKRVMEIDRVGAPVLTVEGSIPIPSPRPATTAEINQLRYVEHGESRIAALDLLRGEELARPREMSPARRDVRVVGGKFLPELNGEMNFMAIATRADSPANGILGSLLAVIEGTIVSSAVAAEH